MNEVIQMDKLVSTLEYDGMKIELFDNGNEKMPNKVYLFGELVHEDETFRPSPLYGRDPIEAMIALAGFYVMTEEDMLYEEGHIIESGRQKIFDFADCENGEDLRCIVSDYEQKDDHSYWESLEITYEDCLSILESIKVED